MKNNTFIKRFFSILLCLSLAIACNNSKVDHPTTAQAVNKTLKSSHTKHLLEQEQVMAFYANRDFAPAWNLREVRTNLWEALKNSSKEGLFLKDYHGKTLQTLLKNENLNPTESAQLEILLTDAFLAYANDLYYGKLNPNELYEIWGINRKEINFTEILQKALQKQEIEKTLADLQPQNNIYSGLKKSLEEYREKLKNTNGKHLKIPSGEAIKPGEKDERIPIIAQRLMQLGILTDGHPSLVYDKSMQKAVKTFQTQKGLANDVILGNATIKELNMDAQTRYNQILVNLERWRWYPRNLGEHYILINIPDYKLTIVKNGKTIKQHNIIAGAKTSKTPVFSDSIQYIVLNPEWNIPQSIRDNEIIPGASEDPNYLKSRNMYVTNSEGERVDPASINWSGEKVKTYNFVQGAGPSNSLGRVKIIYPNKYYIYLHDTPAKAIFSQTSRAESHGCVRVENAVELAGYILNDQEAWNLEKIKETIAKGETKRVKVTQPIKVHHFYWTAWYADGETHFTNDIYDRDQKIWTLLKS